MDCVTVVAIKYCVTNTPHQYSDLGALQMELEELLGTTVDLLTPEDIAPAFRRRVLAEAKPL